MTMKVRDSRATPPALSSGSSSESEVQLMSTVNTLSMAAHAFGNDPNLRYRLDNFSVPEASCDDFEQAMSRNLAFLETLPGFLGHFVFEKTGGPTSFNIATVAVWASQAAIDAAGARVRAYYDQIGFDMPSFIAEHEVTAELGCFKAMPDSSVPGGTRA